MQKIIPHLWFDKEAKAAAEFYVSIFPNSKITSSQVLHDTPSGDCEMMSFELAGYSMMAISAGPIFKLNPSISFMLNFDPKRDSAAAEQLDEIWAKLAAGGKVLMEIGEYPFSQRYGWVQDRFGVSWQLILTNPAGEERPFIIPSLLFVNEACGQAEEASDFYLSVFRNSRRGTLSHYGPGAEPNKEGTLMFSDFQLEGQWFCAMDGGGQHEFTFNEALSFLVQCDSQTEIDYYWNKLSAVPQSEQCGWLKDRYGVFWQISPSRLGEMLSRGTPEQKARVTKAFLAMKKFDVAALERAYAAEAEK